MKSPPPGITHRMEDGHFGQPLCRTFVPDAEMDQPLVLGGLPLRLAAEDLGEVEVISPTERSGCDEPDSSWFHQRDLNRSTVGRRQSYGTPRNFPVFERGMTRCYRSSVGGWDRLVCR